MNTTCKSLHLRLYPIVYLSTANAASWSIFFFVVQIHIVFNVLVNLSRSNHATCTLCGQHALEHIQVFIACVSMHKYLCVMSQVVDTHSH